MKTYTYYICLLLAAFSLISCENELSFNFRENPPKLVMNAFINADSLNNVLFLNLTGRKQAAHVTDATVEIRVNGQLRESLRPLPSQPEQYDPQCRFNITGSFAPGDVVRIDATTDDGEHHAWAEVIVPQRLNPIENIDTATIPLSEYGYTRDYLRYKITFHDRLGEKNYYRIIVDKQTTATNDFNTVLLHNYKFISREDVVLTDGQPTTEDDEDNGIFSTARNIYGVFDDSRFKDASYTMTVYNLPIQEDYSGHLKEVRMDVFVRLLSITETEYYYLKALNIVESDAYDETLNEPIKYPSNVHGGSGIIGISSEISKSINILKKAYLTDYLTK